jgi:hypothetical protein
MPKLQAEVTRARIATATVEAARVTVVHAMETSALEAVAARDSAALLVKDVEDWAALVEREAQERVLRVVAENTVAFTSTHEDAEGLAQKSALLEGELCGGVPGSRGGQGELPWLV